MTSLAGRPTAAISTEERWTGIREEERKDPSTPTGRIYKELRELIMIRRFNDVFHSDAHVYPMDTGDNRVLGIAREYKGKRMLGLFNFSPDEVRVNIGIGVMMQPYGYRWMTDM